MKLLIPIISLVVQVSTHPFTARNTDELSFAKGAEVVVLQAPEGGWWEGKVGDKVSASSYSYLLLVSPSALSSFSLPHLASRLFSQTFCLFIHSLSLPLMLFFSCIVYLDWLVPCQSCDQTCRVWTSSENLC